MYRILTILLVLSFPGIAQEYIFHSEIEEETFNRYISDSTDLDFFKSFHVIDSSITSEEIEKFRKRTDLFISSLPKKEKTIKKEHKRIRNIYNKIHSRFFKQYLLETYFSDIYKSGMYNCVTATALYAYVFDKLDIPYSIKESPAHVYMIAYPNSHKIYLETTVPGELAFKEFQKSQIEKSINSLVESKIISIDTLRIKGYEKTFYDYFYNNSELPAKSLIGVQYYNKALFLYSQEKYGKAEQNLQKATLFYRSSMSDALKKSLIFIKLMNLDYADNEVIEKLVASSNELTLGEDYEVSELKSSVYKFLSNDETDENDIIQSIGAMKKLNDSIAKKEALQLTYHYLAERNTAMENNEKALIYVKELYAINPKNKQIKTLLGYNLVKKFAFTTNTNSTLDTLSLYLKRFPFLEDDNRVITLKYSLMSQRIFNDLQTKKMEKALLALEEMETFLEKNQSKILMSPEKTADLYRIAGSYYYGKKQYKKAIGLYNQGLVHNPENIQIKKLLKWAKEDR